VKGTSRNASASGETTVGRIFTIGHGNKSFEELVEILTAWGIRYLVDIRSYPRSKRNPQFNTEILADALPRMGVTYVWLKAMGGLRRGGLGIDSPHIALHDPGLRNYADHMLSEGFLDAVSEIISLSERGPVCLMCAEADPSRCHRWLAADHLTAQGLEVSHLLGPNTCMPHTLSARARIQGVQVIYDRVGPRQQTFNF